MAKVVAEPVNGQIIAAELPGFSGNQQPPIDGRVKFAVNDPKSGTVRWANSAFLLLSPLNSMRRFRRHANIEWPANPREYDQIVRDQGPRLDSNGSLGCRIWGRARAGGKRR